jgi:aerobic C4-dicarboxylate transport protein
MSEARALTNFAGNSIATVLVATWTDQLDRAQLSAALSGEDPFDEATMLDEHGHGPGRDDAATAGERGVTEAAVRR